ncbi:MAG: hypothetical protein A4E71_00075 [Smithella sp. PtaU1.Bin162]|nr:MAG: hypothetical protein A4E71_00075 [Smithella sp. PtaU1.Bin162]
MKKYIILIVTVAMLFSSVLAHSGLIYSKPEFRGRVIDAETKQPIEGAVVVILYDKWPLIGGPGGPNSYIYKAKETLTDSKGEFHFPPVKSFSLANSDAGVRFIFYKPGYMASYGPTHIKPILIESYFSSGKVGEASEIEAGKSEDRSYIKWKGILGIMELRKVLPKKAMPPYGIPSGYGARQLPLLYEAINQDRKNRGLKGEVE